LLGCVSAQLGGAPLVKAALRVTLWGALAMSVTAGVGALLDVAV
jgi:VIT1/CCC1 family predicted Fe2+/Mn2+ transporter